MTIEEQKELFKMAIKKLIAPIDSQFSDALDFADKFVELGNAFSKLRPDVQKKVIDAFYKAAISTSPFQFNNNQKLY